MLYTLERYLLLVKKMPFSLENEPLISSALRSMPVLRELNREYKREKPFRDHIPMVESHLTIEPALAALVLRNGGAKNVILCSTPYGTNAEVYRCLKKAGYPVFAKQKGESGASEEKCRSFIEAAFSAYEIDGVIDDGGRFALVINDDPQLGKNVCGVVEQTRGGENCWRELYGEENLPLPVISVNESPFKKIEHRYTAQTIVSASLIALKSQFAGKHVAVIGFGDVGREIAFLLTQNYGAKVNVVDIDENKLVEPIFLGCSVSTKHEALKKADVIITVTGKKDVIAGDDFLLLKDGSILINGGRYGEIDVKRLDAIAHKVSIVKDGPENLTQYTLAGNKEKTIYVVARGYPVNIYVGSGNPKEVLDLIFALMLECLRYIYENPDKLKKQIMPAPAECVRKISCIFLKAHGFHSKFQGANVDG
jgi:adenosylhomocysteinase